MSNNGKIILRQGRKKIVIGYKWTQKVQFGIIQPGNKVAKTLHLKFKNIGVNFTTTFIKKDRMRLNKKNRMRIYFRQPSNKLAEISFPSCKSQSNHIDEVHRQKNEGRL